MTTEGTQRYTPRPWSSDFGEALGGSNRSYLEIHLEAVIERVWRYALGGHDCANFQAVIKCVWRCTWRPWSCELAGRNQASLEINLEAVTEWVWRHTWRMWSTEIEDTLGGCDWARLDEYLEAVDGRRSGTQFISQLTRNSGNVTRWHYLWSYYGELAGGGRSGGRYTSRWSYIQGSTWNRENEGMTDNLWCMLFLVYAVLSVRCTWCMLNSLYAAFGVCCTRWMLHSVYALLGESCPRCMLYSVYAALGVCCTLCMLYSVYALLGVCCTRCMLYSVYAVLGVCCTRCMLHSVCTHDEGMER